MFSISSSVDFTPVRTDGMHESVAVDPRTADSFICSSCPLEITIFGIG
jgi:hypothetical protein